MEFFLLLRIESQIPVAPEFQSALVGVISTGCGPGGYGELHRRNNVT